MLAWKIHGEEMVDSLEDGTAILVLVHFECNRRTLIQKF